MTSVLVPLSLEADADDLIIILFLFFVIPYRFVAGADVAPATTGADVVPATPGAFVGATTGPLL